MNKQRKIFRKGLSRQRIVVLGVLGLVIAIAVIAAACGDDDTPTPVPTAPTATPRPGDTPVPTVAIPTSTARPLTPTPTLTPAEATAAALDAAGLRPISEWTCDEPGTLPEVEAALEAHRGENLTFASWGGSFQDAQRAAWITPFEEQFGITIFEETAINYGKIRSVARTGNLLFHVADVVGLDAIGFGLDGVAEELDCAIIDIHGWPDHFKEFFYGAGGAITYSFSILYNTDTYPSGSEPTSVVEFFDFENFPGRRGFWANIGWNSGLRLILAAEMLADDPYRDLTEAEKLDLGTLEPEQIDHAYELWDEAAPNIKAWLYGTQDCLQLLATDELDMCNMDTTLTQDAVEEGLPVDFCRTCPHITYTDQWIVLKGTADNPELFERVQLWLAWVSFPERQAQISKYIGYGPLNVESVPFLEDPAYAKFIDYIPTSPGLLPWAIFINEAAEGQITVEQTQRWIDFLILQGVSEP